MTTYDGRDYPAISPYLYYEDAAAAMDWLIETFGFAERLRGVRPDGTFGHGELELGGGVVMLGTVPGHRSPVRTGQVPFGVHVHVDDVDAHFERAKAAGAQVQEAPTDQPYGVRSYGALDLEGNQWWFATPLAS